MLLPCLSCCNPPGCCVSAQTHRGSSGPSIHVLPAYGQINRQKKGTINVHLSLEMLNSLHLFSSDFTLSFYVIYRCTHTSTYLVMVVKNLLVQAARSNTAVFPIDFKTSKDPITHSVTLRKLSFLYVFYTKSQL